MCVLQEFSAPVRSSVLVWASAWYLCFLNITSEFAFAYSASGGGSTILDQATMLLTNNYTDDEQCIWTDFTVWKNGNEEQHPLVMTPTILHTVCLPSCSLEGPTGTASKRRQVQERLFSPSAACWTLPSNAPPYIAHTVYTHQMLYIKDGHRLLVWKVKPTVQYHQVPLEVSSNPLPFILSHEILT